MADFLGTKAVAAAAEKLPAELQEFATAVIGQLTVLETKAAVDVQAIAAQILTGLQPMVQQTTEAVNTMTLTVNAGVMELTGLARRLNGATVTVTLGPEVPDNSEPQMTVRG